jgi:hypothetical protein
MRVLYQGIHTVMKAVEKLNEETGDVVFDYEPTEFQIPTIDSEGGVLCYFTRKVGETDVEFKYILLEEGDTQEAVAKIVWA